MRSFFPSPPKRRPSARPLRVLVAAEDLEKLDVLHELLATLNDPRASATQIARSIGRHPVLEARVLLAGQTEDNPKRRPRLPEQLARLGNREVEAILLQLLEDLTELDAELKEQGKRR